MGCNCECHDTGGYKFGCCWNCEKEHDPLRNALLQVDALTKLYREIIENKCQRQDDFNFWHGRLLDVQCKTEKQICTCDRAPANCEVHHPGAQEKQKCEHEPDEERVEEPLKVEGVSHAHLGPTSFTRSIKVEHCYGSHCHVIERGSKACICLCSKCKDAKEKDH